MDYVSYKKLRRKEAIEREVYDHTLRKRDRSMDKFQDYILTELKFKDPDRKKLE